MTACSAGFVTPSGWLSPTATELSEIFIRKAKDDGFIMDDITIEDVAALIEAFTEEDWRRKHNGGGMDVLLGGCKEIQATRLFQQAHARHKLVALWGPGHAEEIVQRHEGELFRRPLSPEQTQALSKAAVIALLQPGDVASFSGGLPHATVVVGTELNLTAYESLVNWHPANAGLLLRGFERRGKGVMTRKAKEGLLEDIVEVVKRHASVEAPGLWNEDEGRVLLLQLGSSNDDKGNVDGEVRQRAVKTASLWSALTAAGQHVSVLVSGGADPNRFFNRTSTSHWRYVRQALLDCGLPAEHILDPGLEALHTVDEALMAVEYVREHGVGRLWVVTSDFHAARARHLFHVAFVSAGLSLDLLVLGVPDACEGEVLQAYKAKEVKALEGLRSAPYGAWATYLGGAAEPAAVVALNADRRVHEPFFLTAAAAGSLRGAFRAVLKGSRWGRRLLETQDGGSVESSDSGRRSDLSEKAAMPVKRYDRGCFSAFKLVDASFAALLRSLVFDDVECWSSGLHHCFSVDVTTTATH
eukprot:s609_g16.t1